MNFSFTDNFNCTGGNLRHLEKPLARDKRFNHRLAPITPTYTYFVILHFNKESEFLKVLNNLFSRLISWKTFILPVCYDRILVHYLYSFKLVVLGYFKVSEVVERSYLHRSCPELPVYSLISYNRDFSPHKWNINLFHLCVSFIFWMNRYRSITKERLRSCGSNLKSLFPISLKRVCYVVELPIFFGELNFKVAQCCLTCRTPVYYVVPPVY